MAALAELGHDAVTSQPPLRRRPARQEPGWTGSSREPTPSCTRADTTSPRSYAAVTVGGTRQLLEAAARQPSPPHVVTISIVGVAGHPYSYYRAKRAAELLVERSTQPATVVAATQFHSLAAFFGRVGTIGPIALGVKAACGSSRSTSPGSAAGWPRPP